VANCEKERAIKDVRSGDVDSEGGLGDDGAQHLARVDQLKRVREAGNRMALFLL